jgi:hypothetical protein
MRALSRLASFPWLHLSQTTPFGSTIGGLPHKPWLPSHSGMTCSTLVKDPSDSLQYRQIGKVSFHAIEPSLHTEDTLPAGVNKALPTPPEVAPCEEPLLYSPECVERKFSEFGCGIAHGPGPMPTVFLCRVLKTPRPIYIRHG